MDDRPKKISLVLGPLAKPLAAAATRNGQTLSEEIRQRLAKSLRMPAPKITHGNAAIGSQSAEALRKRWAKGD